MSTLKDYLADDQAYGPAATRLRTPESGRTQPKSNYIALGLTAPGLLPDPGQPFTPPGVGATPVTIGGDTLPGVLRALAFHGQAWLFGEGTINGKKGRPTPRVESMNYGLRTKPRETGDIDETLNFDFRYGFANTAFLNGLRGGLAAYDYIVFTDRTAQIIRHYDHQPVVHNIGNEITGNVAEEIKGGFDLSFSSDMGELIPYYGVRDRDLSADLLRYSFGAPTGLTGLTALAATTRYAQVFGTAGKLTRAVVEGGTPRFSIFHKANETMPTNLAVSVNTNTGEVTFASTVPIGEYKFTVVAENETGVFGKYPVELSVRAA